MGNTKEPTADAVRMSFYMGTMGQKKLSREEIKLRIGITLSKGGGMLWRGQSKMSHESGQVNKSDCERLTAA